GWLSLAGCSAPSDTAPVELRFWAIGAEGEYLSELLAPFHDRNPDIRVRVQQIPWKAAHEKLLTAFAGGALPDICQLGNTWIPEFVALDAVSPLDARLRASRQIPRGDYFPGIWSTNVIHGVLYGIPWYVDTRILFYRRDMLAEAGVSTIPRTWEDWRGAMERIQARMPERSYAILLPTNEWEQLIALGLQSPRSILRDQDRYGNFQSPDFRRACKFYVGLFKDGLAPKISADEIANAWDELARGRYAMYITGPWNIGEFRKRMSADVVARWSTAPLPGPQPPGPGGSLAGGCSLVIFRHTKHEEAAWRLVEYLSEPATQLSLFERLGDLPARQSAWDDPRLARDSWIPGFREQLLRAVPAPPCPEWEQIVTKCQETAERMIRGGLDLDEGLRQLNRGVDRILEKRRWMLARSMPREVVP
ncbi:MAG TPA: sugar ABC transporter substrate-binding protein, partial [Pirellulaceae bacterium]